jgi:UDP-2,4-diacetamido-2,4,6-trideoxy-beta-L-altropyranose hydrolase
MRCRALGQEWLDRGGEVVFAVTPGHAGVLDLLRRDGFSSVASGSEDEGDLLAEHGGGNGWLVLDGYDFGPADSERYTALGCRVALIDDFADRPGMACDILVNQNIFAEELSYRDMPAKKSLLGLRYALLRREFRHRNVSGQEGGEGRRILITMGGGDPGAMTAEIVHALDSVARRLTVTVVVGPLAKTFDSIERAAAESPHHVSVLSSIADMAHLMMEHDLAIAAGGGSCWELAALGVPFIVLDAVPHQASVAGGLQSRGGAVWVRGGSEFSPVTISREVSRLVNDEGERRRLSAILRNMVDGEGASRVVSEMMRFDEQGAGA